MESTPWSKIPLTFLGGAVHETTGYLFDDAGDLFGHREAVGFGEPAFYVRTIDKQLADKIIIANHYSRRVYTASTLHLGVIIGGALEGVLQFGFAMNPASADSVVAGTGMDEYLELNRMWLSDRAARNSESRSLSYSIRLIRRVRPAVKWIQSFADERCGLFGTVYQAAGFTYHGEHVGIFWELDGEFYHNSLMTNAKTAGSPRAACSRIAPVLSASISASSATCGSCSGALPGIAAIRRCRSPSLTIGDGAARRGRTVLAPPGRGLVRWTGRVRICCRCSRRTATGFFRPAAVRQVARGAADLRRGFEEG